MKFNPQTEADFLKHEYFVQSVLKPNKAATEYWQRWLNQNPDKALLYRAACDLLLSFELKQQHQLSESAYYSILDNLLEENNKQKIKQAANHDSRNSRLSSWLLFAASIALVVSVTLVLNFFTRHDVKQSTAAIDYQVEFVPSGFKKTVSLPDGSTVRLNAMSEIKYPTKFSGSTREVYLTGQAFFDVKKNKKRPFIVHTKNFSTTVLGTSFDIRSYEGEHNKHVAVLTGKVQVTTTNGLTEQVTPLHITIYNQEKKVLKKSKFNPATILSWKDGVIAFDHASFNEVTAYLSRWYGVVFIVPDNFKVQGYYTGSFDKEALSTVLTGISYSSHFAFHIEDKKVFITKPN